MKYTFDEIWQRLVKLTGLGIAIWETVVDKVDRPSLLILAAGMMGLQSVIKAARGSGRSNDPK